MPLMKIAGWQPDPEELPEGYKRRAFAGALNAFSAVAATPSGDYDIPAALALEAFDQEQWGACVANAAAGIISMVLAAQGDLVEELSRMFSYRTCREVMGTLDEDSGTFLYLAAERIGKVGICLEKTFRYTAASMWGGIPPECYPEASDNKATAWFDIQGDGNDRLEQLDVAVRSNHPVMFGTTVGPAIQIYRAGQVLSIPGSSLGGHAMVVVGIRYINGRRCWRIRNSWGRHYGDRGHLLVDDAYMGWVQTRDLHLLTRMDPLLF